MNAKDVYEIEALDKFYDLYPKQPSLLPKST